MDDLERLALDMDDMPNRVERQAERLVRDTTVNAQNLGRTFAPVRTGDLRASFGHDFVSRPGYFAGETGPDIDYDVFVHDGTSRQAPQPFMDRAADVLEPGFLAAAERIGDGALNASVRRG